MIIVAVGSLFVFGLFCTCLALQYLTQMDAANAVPLVPELPEQEPEEQPKLTRLGRPVEVRRLQ